MLSVNRELIRLYWDIGREIAQRQGQANWGQRVLERLADDLQKAFPASADFPQQRLPHWRVSSRLSDGGNRRTACATNEPAKVAQPVRQTAEAWLPEPVAVLPGGITSS